MDHLHRGAKSKRASLFGSWLVERVATIA